jgi:hypothetical protein
MEGHEFPKLCPIPVHRVKSPLGIAVLAEVEKEPLVV